MAVEPFTSSQMPAGSQMAHAPIGSSDRNAIVTPQNTGAPMPTAQKSRPPAAPCALATTIADTTLARIRSCAWLMTCSRCSSSNGSTRRTSRMMLRASRNRKNIAKIMTIRSNSTTPTLRSRSPADSAANPPSLRPRSAATSASVMPATSGARCWIHDHQCPTRSNSPAATASCTLAAAAAASRTNALTTSSIGTMRMVVTSSVLASDARPAP